MLLNQILFYLLTTVILLGVLAFCLKEWLLYLLRKKHHLNVRSGLFKIYRDETIYTTHAKRKRNFMRISNVLTVFIFISSILLIVTVVYSVGSWLTTLIAGFGV